MRDFGKTPKTRLSCFSGWGLLAAPGGFGAGSIGAAPPVPAGVLVLEPSWDCAHAGISAARAKTQKPVTRRLGRRKHNGMKEVPGQKSGSTTPELLNVMRLAAV